MSGLVGFWSLAESSGRANDLSGNGNHGTVNGATQGVWGRGGLTAYSFDGTDDTVTVGESGADEIINAPITVSVWARKRTTTSGVDIFDYESTRLHLAYEKNASDGLEFNIYDGSQNTATTGVTITDEWFHILGTFDGSDMRVYVNGNLEGTASASNINDGIGGIYIGGQATSGQYWDGSIADVRVYSRVLSPQEVQTLYEWGSEDYTPQSLHDGTDSGAVSRYTFDGDVTTDSWGTNTLTDNTSAGTTTDAIRGDAKSFDGTDDYMDIGASLGFGSGDFSISAWFNTDSGNARGVSNYDGANAHFDAGVKGGKARIYLRDSNDNQMNPVGNTTINNQNWYHVVGMRNGDTAKIYVNGVLESTSTNSSVGSIDSGSNAYIASDPNGTSYFSGDIDDLRIYDRALSDREVFDLYRWGARGKDMRKEMVTK